MKQPVLSRIRRTLREQDQVISRAQCLAAGARKHDVTSMLRSGTWVRALSGVYMESTVRLTPRRRHVAALLACGPGAVLSHASAAWLWGIVDDPPERVYVTVAAHKNPRPAGVRVHRAAVPPAGVVHDGLRCTDPIRTLIDVAAMPISDVMLDAAVDSAIARGIADDQRLIAALCPQAGLADGAQRHPVSGSRRRPRGAKRLLDSLERRGFVGARQPSVLEARADRLFKRYGIEGFTVEREVLGGSCRLDYADEVAKFAVEFDGFAFHRTPEQLQHDSLRRNRLTDEEWTIKVYTWRDLVERPDEVAREILSTQRRLRAAMPRAGPGRAGSL